MPTSLSSLINLSNSIIGVSLLTMPYCFQQCGILLSCITLAASAFVNKYACHMLIKASMLTRRRKFEYLAYHTLGYNGKLLIELGLICFLLGGCVALFVVAGDILPALTVSVISQEFRIYLMVFIGFFVALPLSLRRNAESLTSFSTISMMFYAFLALKMFIDSLPALLNGTWFHQVVWWNTDNLPAVLPIFAMCLAGQPQVFEVFDLAGTDIHHVRLCDRTVSSAMQTCLTVYILVGFCGYISSYEKASTLPGNSLLLLDDSWLSWIFKFGFLASLIMSFPLCLFPCRTSLHSLIYRRGIKLHEVSSSLHDFIPENRFKLLTIVLLFSTLSAALIIPRIELFLGVTGATVGCIVCIVAPARIYLGATKKDQALERISAQFVILVGLVIMSLCTFSMMNQLNKPETFRPQEAIHSFAPGKPVLVPVLEEKVLPNSRQLDPRTAEPKRSEPVEPHEETPEIQTLTNKTADVRYRIGSDLGQKPRMIRKQESAQEPDVNKKAIQMNAVQERKPEAQSSGGNSKKPSDVSDLPAAVSAAPEEKRPINLLEQIVEVQQEQKKMIEDIQKKLDQGFALHKEIQASKSKETNNVERVKEEIKPVDEQLQQEGKKISSIVRKSSLIAEQKPVEFKGPLKVLNRRFHKNLDESGRNPTDSSNHRSKSDPKNLDPIASLANAAQHQKVHSTEKPSAVRKKTSTSNVVPARNVEHLSGIANKAEWPVNLKDINSTLPKEEPVNSARAKLDHESKPEVKDVVAPLAIKMDPANASVKKKTVHKEI